MSAEEIIQRNELTTLLLRQGYNVLLPVYDQGIDLIAHRDDLIVARAARKKRSFRS